MYKFKVITVFALALVSILMPNVADAQTYQDPINYVSDFANILDDSYEESLNANLKQYEDQTSNQIAVVTISDLQGVSMFDYSYELASKWKLGQDEKDNGILMLINKNGKSGERVYVQVGYGLEGVLPDSRVGRILDSEFLPAYLNKDYETAIDNSIIAFKQSIAGEYTADGETGDNNLPGLLIMIFWVFIFISGTLASTKSWWLGGVLGFIGGVIVAALLSGNIGVLAFCIPIPAAIVGLLYDLFLSKFSGSNKYANSPMNRWSGGGFGGGGFSGGGGGFSGGGGGFGGGGAGR